MKYKWVKDYVKDHCEEWILFDTEYYCRWITKIPENGMHREITYWRITEVVELKTVMHLESGDTYSLVKYDHDLSIESTGRFWFASDAALRGLMV